MPIQPKQQPPYYTPTTQQETLTLLKKETTITNTQIKALPTTPIQILPAPGEGKIINIINTFFSLTIPVAYNENYDLEGLYYEDVLSPSSSNTLGKNNFDPTDNTNQFTIAYANVNAKYQDIAINSPVIYRMDRIADLTGGDDANTLQITIYYTIQTL